RSCRPINVQTCIFVQACSTSTRGRPNIASTRSRTPAKLGQQNRKAEDLSCRTWPEHRLSGPVTAKRGFEFLFTEARLGERRFCGRSDEVEHIIIASFETRRDAEVAVEHLVQQHGIDRSDVFIQAEGAANSAGSKIAGADIKSSHPGVQKRGDPALNGPIEVS